MHIHVESLCCTTETKIILYVNYTLMKKLNENKTPEIDSPNYSCYLFLSGEIMRIYSLSLCIFLLSQRGLENKCFFNIGNIDSLYYTTESRKL